MMASADFLHAPSLDSMLKPARMSPRKRKRTESIKSASALNPEFKGVAHETIGFDPVKHLNFVPPQKVWTMEEIGLKGGVSPNAVSEPFSLFTQDAVQQMRAEILSKTVLDNCQWTSDLAPSQLRGFADRYAPFVYDTWRSREVLDIVSSIAGVELVPAMDLEIGHVNLSIRSKEQQKEAERALREHEYRQLDEGVSGCPFEDNTPIVDWHTDAYPFVCVTMLSDCTDMIGGETALRTGSGEVMKVRGPGMGHAVILQGRYIEHQALRALGGGERITMVTSFRPKSALVPDDTVLTTVRPVSNLSELYFQYTEYRLEMLQDRIRAHLQGMREQRRSRDLFDTQATKTFLRQQDMFLASMLHEMVDDEKVVQGAYDDSHLLSQDLKDRQNKKAKLLLG